MYFTSSMDFSFGFHYFFYWGFFFILVGQFLSISSPLFSVFLSINIYFWEALESSIVSAVNIEFKVRENEEFQTTTVFQAMGVTIGLHLFTFFNLLPVF